MLHESNWLPAGFQLDQKKLAKDSLQVSLSGCVVYSEMKYARMELLQWWYKISVIFRGSGMLGGGTLPE